MRQAEQTVISITKLFHLNNTSGHKGTNYPAKIEAAEAEMYIFFSLHFLFHKSFSPPANFIKPPVGQEEVKALSLLILTLTLLIDRHGAL